MSSVKVHHVSTGSPNNPPVILSSSLGMTHQMWDPQLAALEEKFWVIRYDHRGHGASPVPPGPYQLEDLSQDVIALMDHLGLERSHFVGLSLGGMIGMWLGAYASDRIDRLALLCTVAVAGSPEMWHERAATARESGPEPLADASLERWFTPKFRDSNPDLMARYRSTIAGLPWEGYAACCEAIAGLDLVDHLDRITAPTLMISGSHDPGAPPEAGRLISDSIPGAEFEVLETAHFANVELPGAVNPLLVAHLS